MTVASVKWQASGRAVTVGVTGGKWQVANGKWQMAVAVAGQRQWEGSDSGSDSGRWQVRGGRWQCQGSGRAAIVAGQ